MHVMRIEVHVQNTDRAQSIPIQLKVTDTLSLITAPKNPKVNKNPDMKEKCLMGSHCSAIFNAPTNANAAPTPTMQRAITANQK